VVRGKERGGRRSKERKKIKKARKRTSEQGRDEWVSICQVPQRLTETARARQSVCVRERETVWKLQRVRMRVYVVLCVPAVPFKRQEEKTQRYVPKCWVYCRRKTTLYIRKTEPSITASEPCISQKQPYVVCGYIRQNCLLVETRFWRISVNSSKYNCCTAFEASIVSEWCAPNYPRRTQEIAFEVSLCWLAPLSPLRLIDDCRTCRVS